MTKCHTVRSICVFGGSRAGDDAAFSAAAAALGAAIARRGMTLVYGGARVGLMGVLANAALAGGGRVVGVIPKGLVSKEIAHDGLSELYLTETMHERKERMILLADAFVAMPGGWGTYDEIFEVLTLAQIGLHEKPSAFLNVAGYYDPLLALLEHAVEHELAAPQHAALYVSSHEAEALLDAVVAWTPPPFGPKWTDRRAVGAPDAGADPDGGKPE